MRLREIPGKQWFVGDSYLQLVHFLPDIATMQYFCIATTGNIWIMAKQRTGRPKGNPALKKGEQPPNGFKPGFDPKRNLDGAPPKLTKLQILEHAFGMPIKSEFTKKATDEVKLMLTEMSLAELKVFAERTDVAVFAVAFAKNILENHKDKTTDVFEKIHDRAFGRPQSSVTLKGDDDGGSPKGLFIYLPSNGREVAETEQNTVSAPMDKSEPSTKKTE